MRPPDATAPAEPTVDHIGRRSLRVRLVAGLVAVALLGLLVADGVIYHQVGSYLVTQADAELGAVNPQAVTVDVQDGTIQNGPFGPNNAIANSIVEVATLNGALVASTTSGSGHLVIPAHTLAQMSALAAQLSRTLASGAVSTAPPGLNFTTSTTTHRSYRVLAEIRESRTTLLPEFLVVLVGIPLSSVAGTLHQLLVTEILVSVGVLLLLIGLGYAVVRIGLRPLGAIEETAAAIAAGDLSRRVDSDDGRTEVGRLGRSLNAMLSRIEFAFSEQRASEERLRQFVSDASHELRTPVTSIRGYAELFRRGAANRPEDLARAMGRIEDEATRMGGLVEDLLLLARLDEGRPLERDRVDLSAIAADCVADAQVIDPGRTIVLRAPDPVVVDGDGARLRQVGANLLQNALRYTPQSAPITVVVRTEGDHALFTVRDEGPGIAPDHAAHIFERFYRGDPSRARQSGGSGLGLAIVASIAEAHGGSARVETEPGHGARFIIAIPLERPAPPLPGPGASPAHSTPAAGAGASGGEDLEGPPHDGRSETLLEEQLDRLRPGTEGGEEHRADVVPAHKGTEIVE